VKLLGFSKIGNAVTENLAVVVAMIALLIVSAMTAAASIETQIRSGVITAAGFLELYLLMWMIGQFS
jgi:hypothetical protein